MTSKSASCNYTPSAFMGLSRGVCLVTLGAATPPCNIPEFSCEGEDLVQCCKIFHPPLTASLTHSLTHSLTIFSPAARVPGLPAARFSPASSSPSSLSATAPSAPCPLLPPPSSHVWTPCPVTLTSRRPQVSAVQCSGVQWCTVVQSSKVK